MHQKLISFIITSIVGSIFYLSLGWLIFDFALGDYTESHTTQLIGFKKNQDFSFLFLYLSCLAYSTLMCFYLVNSTISSTQKAFFTALIIGVLIACMTDFYWLASSNFYSNFVVVILDIGGAALTVGTLGALNYFVLSKTKFYA